MIAKRIQAITEDSKKKGSIESLTCNHVLP